VQSRFEPSARITRTPNKTAVEDASLSRDVTVNNVHESRHTEGVENGTTHVAGSPEVVLPTDLVVTRVLTTGHYCQVCVATYKNRDVAVKLLTTGEMTQEQRRELREQQKQNVDRELRTLKRTSHPNIVRLMGVCLEPPMAMALVLEYLGGGSIFELLYLRQVQPPSAARLKMANELALALCYLQASEPMLVHGDVKTANVLLDLDPIQYPTEFKAKLCDFSKSRLLETGEAQRADFGGSPRYLAPECFVGGSATEKVDIWGLACCLVEVLGGPIPYEDLQSTRQIVHRVVVERLPPMAPYWFLPNLRAILAQCFDFNEAHRPCIGEVQLCLKQLTPQEIERAGMDRRRTS
jgi:serine/threonine protein kinase